VEGGTFKEKNRVGKWHIEDDPDKSKVWIEVHQRGEVSEVRVDRDMAVHLIAQRAKNPINGPVEWERTSTQPPTERGWRHGDKIKIWDTDPTIPIETHVTIYRNTTQDEIARMRGIDPALIYRWSGGPPLTDGDRLIGMITREEHEAEIRERHEQELAAEERTQRETEDVADTPLVEWTKAFKLDPEN
jgi:hypothetical protein